MCNFFFFFLQNYSTVPHSCLKFVTWTDCEMIFSWFALLVTQLQLATVASIIQGCRQGGGLGGLKPPPDFNSCYFTAKERWKQERKKQLSGYKHAILHTNIEAQKCPKYTNSAVITCNKLIGYTAHRQIVSSVLVDMQYCTPVQSNLLCCCT